MHSREYKSIRVREHVHLVRCRRCHQLFGFETFRVGRGYAQDGLIWKGPPQEIADARAAETARELARTSPEIVPCPHCGYLAPEMVDQWGRGEQHLALIVGALLSFGGIIFLPLGASLFAGPHPPKTVWVPALIAGALISLIGVAMIAWRAWSLARSRPVEGPDTAQQLLDHGYLPALIPTITPDGLAVHMDPATPVFRSSDGDFDAPVLKCGPPRCCGLCLREMGADFPAFFRCRQCDAPRQIVRFAIAGACVVVMVTLAMKLVSPKDLGGVLMCALAGFIGLLIAVWLIIWFVPRSVARCSDSLRGVMRVSSRYRPFVELLGEYYTRIDYSIVVQRALYEAMLADAEHRYHHPLPRRGFWKRLMDQFTTQMVTSDSDAVP